MPNNTSFKIIIACIVFFIFAAAIGSTADRTKFANMGHWEMSEQSEIDKAKVTLNINRLKNNGLSCSKVEWADVSNPRQVTIICDSYTKKYKLNTVGGELTISNIKL
ncbi:hypothetical protein AB6D11_18620 [Vibrio splendidus]|nr:hypothetical protein ACS79_20315 [Vibrio lentus]